MDVAITPSSPAAVPSSGPQVSDLDAARRAQARQDEQNAQDKIEQQRLQEARQAQDRQSSRNFNGELIGTTISTTA
jgi:hypothetical protein